MHNNSIIPGLLMTKLRHGETKKYAQGYIANMEYHASYENVGILYIFWYSFLKFCLNSY